MSDPTAELRTVDVGARGRGELPMRMWRRHRATSPGDRVALTATVVDGPGPARAPGAGGAGTAWPGDLLGHVVTGAGFTVVAARRQAADTGGGSEGVGVRWELRRERTLADTVAPGMRLLLVGLNPSLYAADAGVGFARPGNRAWPALLAAGLAEADRDPERLLVAGRVGMSDLAKRATPRADELTPAELAAGLARLDALCAWLRPAAVCVLGVTGWRAATGERTAGLGTQARRLGGRPVHVAPNPSGANAHTSVADLVDHLHAALALAG